MATVTGYTAARMDAIEAASVVDGDVVGDNLILTKHDGSTVNAGNVRGPQGNTGPTGPTGPASIALNAWPIGSIFIGAVSTSPATLLGGGTWARFGQGRVLVSQSSDTDFDVAEKTGGTKTHTLTTAELAAHTHAIATGHSGAGGTSRPSDSGGSGTGAVVTTGSVTESTGSGTAFSIVQPYIVVYMWKRTA